MKIAIISNLVDGKGLFRDAHILQRLLESWAHEVHLYDFRALGKGLYALPRDYLFTVVIHLEIVAARAFSWSDKQIWIPNPDWTTKEKLQWADAFRVIVAKTREGERELKQVAKRVIFTGFESEDRKLDGVAREDKWFHTRSESIVKGTRSVLRAWDLMGDNRLPQSFMVGTKVGEEIYRLEQNRCKFWIQPSSVEGYGHSIHEGLSVGAAVVTLDAPPMNESAGIAALVPCRRVSRQNLADCWEARPEAIKKVCEDVHDGWNKCMFSVAREAYLNERAAFRLRFRRMLEEAL